MTPETAPRLCPDCRAPMKPHDAGDLRLDLCEACGGVWYDAGEFSRMVHEGPSAIDGVEAQEPSEFQKIETRKLQACPVCQVPLNSYGYAGNKDIVLNGCPQCAGIFIEPDSLKHLDTRQHQYAGDDPSHPIPEDVAIAYATLDGQRAADLFKSKFAQYNWNQLMTPVAFS